MQVLRFDASRLDASRAKRTGAGALRVPALATSSGVFTYTDSDGHVVREWRPPEEVQKADSVATLADLPVTRGHPPQNVDPSSWARVAIGHSSSPRTESTPAGAPAVACDLVIARGDAQAQIGKPDGLIEVSCGYLARIDATPGVTPTGQAYDRVQRDIRYNHIALGPSGWGRQGPAMAVRLDGAGDQQFPRDDGLSRERPDATAARLAYIRRLQTGEQSAPSRADAPSRIDAPVTAEQAREAWLARYR